MATIYDFPLGGTRCTRPLPSPPAAITTGRRGPGAVLPGLPRGRAPERVVEVSGITLGEVVAVTQAGRTRRARVLEFQPGHGSPTRARLMVCSGYVGAGTVISADVSALEAV